MAELLRCNKCNTCEMYALEMSCQLAIDNSLLNIILLKWLSWTVFSSPVIERPWEVAGSIPSHVTPKA